MAHDVKCPRCPRTFAENENSVRDVEFSVAQHMVQSDDHPDTNYAQARQVVIDFLDDRDDGEGSDPIADSDADPDPDAGEDEPAELDDPVNEPAPESPAEPDMMETNPLLRAPIADGGQKSEPGDCPDCGNQMNHASVGNVIKGQLPNGDVVRVETEDGDEWCPRCNVLRASMDGGTEVIR